MSALIGMAVAEGKIDTARTLGELGINEKATPLTTAERQARVIDLLQARSGVYIPAAAEIDAMRDARPKRGSHPPGTFWYYNNWDFNVLGTIFRQATGEDIFQAFDRRIARPIGMQDYRAAGRRVRRGRTSEHPAFGFRVSARDLARFGLLYLHRGRWRGQQLIPSRGSTPASAATPAPATRVHWPRRAATDTCGGSRSMRRRTRSCGIPDGSFTASGNGGQRLTVIPQIDTIVVNLMNTDEPGPRIGSNEWDTLVAEVLEGKRGIDPDSV